MVKQVGGSNPGKGLLFSQLERDNNAMVEFFELLILIKMVNIIRCKLAGLEV